MIYRSRHHGCRVDEFIWRGHRLIVLENEVLRMSVLASKGADIVELRYKPHDLDVLWHAPQPVLPAGEGVMSCARGQGAFLDYYAGGWQEVLPNAGPATVYKGAELGQHGETALLPWDVRVLEDEARRVVVEFAVETLRTPFQLVRAMALESGSPQVTLTESLTNLGEEAMHYAWGHHPAFGAPFLEPGCLIELPDCEVIEPAAVEPLQRRFAVEKPGRFPYLSAVDGKVERVDQVQPKERRTEDVLLFSGLSEGRYALKNPRTGLSVALSWDVKVFPYLWSWQVYGGSFGYPYYGRAYTLALEPFNCPFMSLAEAVERNTAQQMQAGAAVKTELMFSVETSQSARP